MSDGIPRDKLCEMLTVAEKRIAELEKENSELKKWYEEYYEINGYTQEGGADVCKWIEDSNGWTHTSCGVTPFKINPYPTEEQMCGHCRKPIHISEGVADE